VASQPLASGVMTERVWLSNADWYASLPVLYAAVGGLITNTSGNVLLVQPNYRPYWAFPGGILESDEPPHEGCAREVREELGLEVDVGALLVVDWAAPRGDRPRPIMYLLFDCGVFDDYAQIRLLEEELDAYVFVSPEKGAAMLDAAVAPRLPAALQARHSGHTRYLPAPTPAVDNAARSSQ
jgi:8-oxo-dGTP diphosphatase